MPDHDAMHALYYDGHVGFRKPGSLRDSDFRVPGSPPPTVPAAAIAQPDADLCPTATWVIHHRLTTRCATFGARTYEVRE